jgi:hypothetical protein
MAAIIELKLLVRDTRVIVRASVTQPDLSQDITIPHLDIYSIQLADRDGDLVPLLAGTTTLADIECAVRQWAQVRERLENMPKPVRAESVPF